MHDDKGVTTISNDGATIMKVRDETRSPRGVGTADDARNETRRSANTSPRAPALFASLAKGRRARKHRVETVFAKKQRRARFVSAFPTDRATD